MDSIFYFWQYWKTKWWIILAYFKIFKCRHDLERKENAQTSKSMRKHKSRELSGLLKPASSLVASACLDDLEWKQLQRSQTAQECGAELTVCEVPPPREIWDTQGAISSSFPSSVWRGGSQPSQVWKLLFNINSLIPLQTRTHTQNCIFTSLTHVHCLKNLRINRPWGMISGTLSSSAAVTGKSGTEERKPKAIKVSDRRVKTRHYSRSPKNCNRDLESSPQLFSIDSGLIAISPTD